MKCPKCGYISHAYLDQCKKCSRDFAKFKKEYDLVAVKPVAVDISAPIAAAGAPVTLSRADGPQGAEKQTPYGPEVEDISSVGETELIGTAVIEQPEEVSMDELDFDIGRIEKMPAAEETEGTKAETQEEQRLGDVRAGFDVDLEGVELDLDDFGQDEIEEAESEKGVGVTGREPETSGPMGNGDIGPSAPEVDQLGLDMLSREEAEDLHKEIDELKGETASAEEELELRPEDIALDMDEAGLDEAVLALEPRVDESVELPDFSLDDLPMEPTGKVEVEEDEKKENEGVEGIEEIDFELEDEDLDDIGKQETS